jgi:hypothetical protein
MERFHISKIECHPETIENKPNTWLLMETTLTNLVNLSSTPPIYTITQPSTTHYMEEDIISSKLIIDFHIERQITIVETYNSVKLSFKPLYHV